MIIPGKADLSLTVGDPVENVEGGEGQGEQQPGQAVNPAHRQNK